MRRWVVTVAAVVGLVTVGGGLLVGVVTAPVSASEAGAGATLVVLAGLCVAAVKLYRSGADDGSVAPPPWTDDGALAEGTPEETADPADVTGAELATLVDDARERAREAETVEEGFAVVRRPLRETLRRVLETGGTDPEAVEELLATGEWTDDRVAAAVVDERVALPRDSLRGRLRAWLFPERVVRRGTARAVDAVAAAAERELPPVVGGRAPRTVPTLAPALGTLQRAADGTLQRADATARPDRGDGEGTDPSTGGSDEDGTGDRSGADGHDEPDDGNGVDGEGSGVDDELLGEVWEDA